MSINSRDQFLLKGRPEIPSIQNTTKTLDLEVFQNKVLRPILKLQNTIFVSVFLDELRRKKQDFTSFNSEDKHKAIQRHLNTNTSLKQRFLGIVMGLFTNTEMDFYQRHMSAINKRIFSMLKIRLEDQLI
ncbi:MAG: glyoxalase [Flavobacteriaceae bacterium]|tara:strand:+ start:1571 stop:1960 length:390 start_codon:yes stop_codon:yes gene_type:complete